MWKLTDSEWKVLEALWAGGPQHLGQILGALAGDVRRPGAAGSGGPGL